MAIKPIDLQTLFTQMDKVAKTQIDQKEGVQIQQALQGAMIQKRTEEKIRSVNEAQNSGEGTEPINDRNKRKKNARTTGDNKPNPDKEASAGEDATEIVRDPDLGQNIDVSG